MQLGERIYLVGSGSFGFDLTDPYPADYRLEPCAVDEGLGEGGLSFLLEHGGRRSLFAGDVVFHHAARAAAGRAGLVTLVSAWRRG